MDIEFTDRYQALGIPYPDPATICQGQCEGTGIVPHSMDWRGDERFDSLWGKLHRRCSPVGRVLQFFRFDLAWKYGWRTHWNIVSEPCDGWHFITCPDCNGTGKRA